MTEDRERRLVQSYPLTIKEDPFENGWREETFEPLAPLEFTAMPWYFRTLESWLDELERAGWRNIETREPSDPRTGEAASLILIAEPREERTA